MKLVFFLFFFVVTVSARPVPPPPAMDPGNAGTPGPPGLSIESNIIILGASAIFYGAYVVYTRRKVSKC